MAEASEAKVNNIEVDPRYVLEVQNTKINELNGHNTMLLALVSQQQEQIRQHSETIEALANAGKPAPTSRTGGNNGKRKKG